MKKFKWTIRYATRLDHNGYPCDFKEQTFVGEYMSAISEVTGDGSVAINKAILLSEGRLHAVPLEDLQEVVGMSTLIYSL